MFKLYQFLKITKFDLLPSNANSTGRAKWHTPFLLEIEKEERSFVFFT